MTRLPSALRPLFPLVKAGVLGVTRAVSPLTRRLPSRVPRHTADDTAAYARAHADGGVVVTEVAAAIDLDRPLPAGLPPDHPQFAAHRRAHIDAGVVARVRNGRMLGDYAAVITEDDTLLFDLSPYYGVRRASQHPVFLRVRLPEMRSVAGSVAVLNTCGTDNYYHWLTDVLPRLELLRRAGAEPGAYLVNRNTRFQCDMLDHLGLTADRCLAAPHLRADELIVPSLPDANLKTPPWVVPWLRAQFLPDDIGAPHRRLFVGRGRQKHTRRLENEAELLAALGPLGFEAIDPGAMAPAEQVRWFAEAECVVGVHGVGLDEPRLRAAGVGVLELFAPDYVNECFWALATTVDGLRYRYLVGDGTPSPARRNRGVASDVTVDPRQVLRLLGELL